MNNSRVLRLDAMQGSCEAWTEPYMEYGEGMLEQLTQQNAKSAGGVFGSAEEQTGAAQCA